MSELRNRDRSTQDVNTYYHEDHWPSGSTYDYPGLTGRHLEYMSDVVTPNYRQIIADGGIVNNPCSYVKSTITTSGGGAGSHQNLDGTQGWTSYGCATAALKPSSPDSVWPQIAWPTPSMKDSARVKLEALSRVDSSQYAFGEDTAELKETLQFLRHPVDSLLGLTRQHQLILRKVRRKQIAKLKRRRHHFDERLSTASRMKQFIGTYQGNAKALASAYADVWAQYSFAAAPLYRSMNDAVEAYYTLPDRVNVLGRQTAHSRDSYEWTDSWNGLDHTVNAYVTRRYSISRRMTKSIHASILYEVRNPIRDLKQGLGLRPKDFPVTMWQIMPLSFMVDRIYDVSSLLKATINIGDPKVKILAGSITSKSELYSTIQLTNVIATAWPGNTTGEVLEDTQFSYERLPWTPTIHDAIPQFNARPLIDSATKIADTLAVVTKLLL